VFLYICIGALRLSLLFAKEPLPSPDTGRPLGPDAFSPAARSPAGESWPGMVYKVQGRDWEGWCSTGNRGTRPATERCGGRGGAMPFPAKGRRTRGFNTRMSINGTWGGDFHTWIGRRGDDAGCRRRGRARAALMRGGSG
jgi:hypothetical protein